MRGAGDFYAASPHLPVVERVIAAMREREEGALDLRSMAEIANLSPYHFARTFRKVTGSPPGEFLTACRLQRAKQLLLNTTLGVAEICHEVGYESLGSFTTSFKQLVGLSPGRIRRLPEELDTVFDCAEFAADSLPAAKPEAGIAFRVQEPERADGVIFVGLFPSAIPQGRPAAGTILGAQGVYRLPPVPDGNYHLMAASLPRTKEPTKLLLPGDALRVGRAEHPLTVRGGEVRGTAEVALRPVYSIDPPVLVALPALLAERLASTRGGHTRRAR
jgi:AraC family transcriptional regulator